MRIALVSVTVLLVACSGAGVPAGLIPPEFRVRQPAGQIGEGYVLVDETSIDLLVDVLNRSSEPITLRRLSLQAVSGGAFGFEPASRTFDETIPPGQVRTVDMWVRAKAENVRMDPSNPVSVRGSAIFDSGVGSFRRVFIEPIALGVEGGSVPR